MTQTAVVPDQLRSGALEAMRSGRLHAGVDVGWRWLAANPDDAEVREGLVSALKALGLETLGGHVASGLAGSSGAIPWGTRRAMWSANLAALASRDPGLASALRGLWNSCREAFELYQCRDGNFQVRLVEREGPGVWLPPFADHRRAAAEVQAPGGSFASGNCGLIHGVYLGWLIERVYRETARVYLEFSCPLYVLAPSGAELAAAMHLHDWGELLGDRRVRLFVGPDCIEQFERFIGGHPLYPLPAWRLTQPSWDDSRAGDLQPAMERLAVNRRQETARTHGELQRVYAGRDVKYWAERYERLDREPLRVLGLVSRHSTFIRGSMEASLEALRSLGCECRVLTEAEPFFLGNSPREIHEVQSEFRPDLILMIDNYRGQMPGMLTPHVPVVMWIQDALGRLINREAGRAMGPLDFVMGYARRDCVEECDYPADGFLECDVPTGFGREIRVSPEWRERHSCDVSFISTASKPPERIHAERRAESPPQTWPLIDAIYEKVRDMLRGGRHLCFPRRLLEETMCETGVEIADAAARRDLATWYVFRLFDWGFRQEALGWTAEWARRTGRRLHLYGRGWEAFEGLSEFARGHVWERDEVAAVHRLSRINLQLFAYTALHQRTYDILGAGGMVLFRRSPIDYRDDELSEVEAALSERGAAALEGPEGRRYAGLIAHHFEDMGRALDRIGKGLPLLWKRGESAAARHQCLRRATFANAEEMSELLERYLDEEPQRQAAARGLRESILPRSTYRARMESMLEFVSSRLRLRARYGCRGFVPARGPEPSTTAKICIRRAPIRAGHPEHGARLNRDAVQLCEWTRRAGYPCEVADVQADFGRHGDDRDFAWLDSRCPDLVIAFGRGELLEGEFDGLRQVVPAVEFHGGTRGLAGYPGARLVSFVNAGVDSGSCVESVARWTGLSSSRVLPALWPIVADAGSVHEGRDADPEAGCDIAVHLPSIAPVPVLLRAWRERLPVETAEILAPVLDRIGALQPELLSEFDCAAMPGVEELHERVVGGLESNDNPALEQLEALRAFGLRRIIDTWIQELWLTRLAGWVLKRGLSLRVTAASAWESHEVIGRHVAGPKERGRSCVARLRIGFGTGAIPHFGDLRNIVAGRATLLWRPRPADPPEMRSDAAGGPDASRPFERWCDEAASLTFGGWDELTERIGAEVERPGQLTEQTRAVGPWIASRLRPERVIGEMVDWAMGGS